MGGGSSKPQADDTATAQSAPLRPRLTTIAGGEFWIALKEEVGKLLATQQLQNINENTYKLNASPPMLLTTRSLADLVKIVGSRKVAEAIRDSRADLSIDENSDLATYAESVQCFYLVSIIKQKPQHLSEIESPVISQDNPHGMSRRSSAASFITPLPSCVGEEVMIRKPKLAIEAPKANPAPTFEDLDEEDDDEDVATVPQGEENMTSICLNAQAASVADVIDSFVEGVESGQSEIAESPPPSQRKRATRRRPTSSKTTSGAAAKASPRLPNKWELYCINENNPTSTHRQKREHKSPIKTSPPPASKRIRS